MNNISVTRTRNERIEFMNFNKIIKEFKNSRKSLAIWKEKERPRILLEPISFLKNLDSGKKRVNREKKGTLALI